MFKSATDGVDWQREEAYQMRLRKGQVIQCIIRQDLKGRPEPLPYTIFGTVLSSAAERKSEKYRVKEISYGQEVEVSVFDCASFPV